MEKLIKNYALRYYMSIFAIVIGATLIFIGKYFLNNILIFSIGLGCIIGGTITYIPNRNAFKDSNYRKKLEQTYDERFIDIGQKSSEIAINIILPLIGLLALTTYIFPIQAYKICLILIALVFTIKYFCYKYYNGKNEEVEEIAQQDVINKNSASNYSTAKKIACLLSIVIVFIGTLFSFEIGNVYIGSFFMKQIGITNELYFKIINSVVVLLFLALGHYSSKIDYPKLNKFLTNLFGKMVLISIILIVINLFLNNLRLLV